MGNLCSHFCIRNNSRFLQSIRNITLTRAELLRGMGHLILPPDLIDNLGPAVTSGRSILMYGPPGNGKSSISNGIRDALGDKIYVPRAIEYSGQVITVYDPIVHTAAPVPMDDPNALRRTGFRFDTRYVYCDRPTVITGGELTLDMLDLKYNPVARTYQAPLQLKATGGIFIVATMCGQVLDKRILSQFDAQTSTVVTAGRPTRTIGQADELVAEIARAGFDMVSVQVQPRRHASDQDELLVLAAKGAGAAPAQRSPRPGLRRGWP